MAAVGLAGSASAAATPAAVIGADAQVNCATNTVPVTLSNNQQGSDAPVTFEVRVNFVADATLTRTVAAGGSTVVDVPITRNGDTTIQVAAADPSFFTGRLVSSLCDIPDGTDLAVNITNANCFYQTGVLEPFPASVFSASNAGNTGQAAYAFVVDDNVLESGILAAGDSRTRAVQLDLNTNALLEIYTVDDENVSTRLTFKIVNPGACYGPVAANPSSAVVTSLLAAPIQLNAIGDTGAALAFSATGAPSNAYAVGFGAPTANNPRSPASFATDQGVVTFDAGTGKYVYYGSEDAVVTACSTTFDSILYFVQGRTYVEGNIVGDPTNVATSSITVSISSTLVPVLAVNDAYASTPAADGSPVRSATSLLANDCDQAGNTPALPANLKAALVTQATQGTVVVSPDGFFTYAPKDPTYSGDVTFTYSITTTDAGTPRTSTATVTIRMTGLAAATAAKPVLANTGAGNTVPITALGAGMILLGAGAVATGRRRETS